jgi:predicted amidohydrolase
MNRKTVFIRCMICYLLAFSGNGLLAVDNHAVRIMSICFKQDTQPVETLSRLIDRQAEKGTDLICLPEAWAGSQPDAITGKTVALISNLARKHHTYIVCPLIIRRGEFNYNTAILFDREGKIAGIYDKIFPYWTEFTGAHPVQPAQNDAVVIATDFGQVGFAICYDAKFPEVFQRLRDLRADLVVWSSAYSGFTELQAYATLHHYYIITSTWTGDCLVYDINGWNIFDVKDTSDISIANFELDMDRQIYHYNFNQDKLKRLLSEHGDDIIVDCDMPREEWFVLKAKNRQISARALAQQYGLEPLRDYIDRSRKYINDLRGFDFSQIYGGYPH